MNNREIKDRINYLATEIYRAGTSGGNLHIVLDDGNLEEGHIRWCLQRPNITPIEKECGELLLKLSYSSRRQLYRDNGFDWYKH